MASPFTQTQIPPNYRQPSQPGTPLGPPISLPRQASGGYPQPTSPFQHRPSSGVVHTPFGNPQISPAQPVPATIPRQPSTPSTYGSHTGSLEERHRRSQSERERSISVSPKTRVPSLARSEIAMAQNRPAQHVDIAQIPTTKRKMDDRELSESTLNTALAPVTSQGRALTSSSPQAPAKKRIRYTEPPIWARSVTGRLKTSRLSPVVKGHPNGNQVTNIVPSHTPAIKLETNGVSPVERKQSETDDAILGPWEASINGVQPYEEISKVVADWLFLTVVNRPDAGELQSRNVEIEIEAKLGQLIDQETNQRIYLPVQTECVLTERKRINFRSSMTEASTHLSKLVYE